MRRAFAAFIMSVLLLSGTFAGAQEKVGIESDSALPFMIDIEKTAGWMVYLEGGYQWNFFRGAGLEIKNGNGGNGRVKTEYYNTENYTKGGMAGAVALGYNFCPKAPITIGMKLGAGPSNKLEHTSADGRAYHWQRVGLYTLDFSLDYDFKNRTKFTPFVGLNGGAVLISQKARAWYDSQDNGTRDFYGEYDSKRSVNFMGGARTGVKYDLTPRIALTLFGQYNYLGSISGKDFAMTDGRNTMIAETQKIKAHMVQAKLGVRIAF